MKFQVAGGTPTYACNGVTGAAGATGSVGATGATGAVGATGAAGAAGTNGTSVVASAESAGANCANGGMKFQIGSGAPAYVCNGATGATGATGTSCTIATVNFVTSLTCTDSTSFALDTKYGVGGSVSGLAGTVVLKNNGGDALTVNASGSFTFATGLLNGAGYSVSVFTQPSTQTCSVSSATGTISSASVSNVAVSCACNSGVGNCDGNAANGCETNTNTDAANCGTCGTICSGGTSCSNGTCTSPASQCNPYSGGNYYRVNQGGYVVDYATIDCAAPGDAIMGCTNGKWKVPTGWQLVNGNDTWLVPYVLQANVRFGTSVVVRSDGHAFVTANYAPYSGTPAGSPFGGSFFADDGAGGYGVTACNARPMVKKM